MALPSLGLVRSFGGSRAPSRRRAARAVSYVKRRGRSAGAAAWKHKAPIGVFGGSALLGYLDAQGHLEKLPVLGNFKPVVTAGVIGYFATRNSSNPTTRAAGLGALAVAGYALGHDWGQPK